MNLVLRTAQYRQTSLRDAFVDFARSPLNSLLRCQDNLHLLRNVSFKIKRGERVAILGVNGSGKTTLCRSIAGMCQPETGHIRIRGTCRAIFDTYAGVISELTGRENARLLMTLLFPAETSKVTTAWAEEAAEFSELGTSLDTPWETYSLGMKARLFLSVITSRPVDLLILDEVYDNTDQFFQKKMTQRLDRFIRESQAFLFVSHSKELAARLCERAIVLASGKIAYDGPIERAFWVYDRLHDPRPPQPLADPGLSP